MEKVREHKLFVIVTSIITLLPIIVGIALWNRLPEQMATHFGSNGTPNDWSPICSIVCALGIYGHEMGFSEVNSLTAMKCTLGIMLIAIGNYLPKCRQNYTIGVKLPWTLEDEDIWNRTHRFTGWLWIICGILFIIEGFLGFGGLWFPFLDMAVMFIGPIVYSLVIFMRSED